MESIKGTLNSEELKKWTRNTLIFLAPIALIYLTYVTTGIKDGFIWSAFIPSPLVTGAMITYVLSVIQDFFRKLIAGK